MVKVEISTAIWYCGLWQFYVCKEHLKSRPGSVTYRYQQKTKKTKIKMVFFNTLLLIFVDVGWVARHIIAITPEKWWNQYRRKITSLRFKFFNWKFLFRIAWKHFPIKTKDTAAAETEKTEPHDYADYGYARKLLFIELSPIKWLLNSVRSSSYYYHAVLPFSFSLWTGTRHPGFLDQISNFDWI